MTQEKPTRSWTCEVCHQTLHRYRGQNDILCSCGAWYNLFGQRLRNDWMDNPSNYDDEISDLDGYEIAALRRELASD